MIILSEWDRDYFKFSKCEKLLSDYMQLEKKEDILRASRELLETQDIVAFGTVADVFLDPMPDCRWGLMNPYWSLKALLRTKARELLAENEAPENEDSEKQAMLETARHMALRVLWFLGYQEEDIISAWKALSVALLTNDEYDLHIAEEVIQNTLYHTYELSEELKKEMGVYFAQKFRENPRRYLSTLICLGEEQAADALEEVFHSLQDKEHAELKATIMEQALYSPHLNISDRFRPIGREYWNLYNKMKNAGEVEDFPLQRFDVVDIEGALDALDTFDSVISSLTVKEKSYKEKKQLLERLLAQEVYDVLCEKLYNRYILEKLPSGLAAYLMNRLLKFYKKDYAGLVKLLEMAKIFSSNDKNAFEKVISKGKRMLPFAKALHEEYQEHPMD